MFSAPSVETRVFDDLMWWMAVPVTPAFMLFMSCSNPSPDAVGGTTWCVRARSRNQSVPAMCSGWWKTGAPPAARTASGPPMVASQMK
jgi:hypothetical protein